MKYLFGLFFCVIAFTSQAQLTKENREKLTVIEDSMKIFAREMIQNPLPENRIKSDSIFTRMLVRAMQVPHSFHYTFDSIITVSRLYAPDSAFKIFTWQLIYDDETVRQRGAIQMRTTDGSLKLFPLLDYSDKIENIADTITNHKAWVGAIYYRILLNKVGDEKIYTLLGFDENTIHSSIKYIEILRFVDGEPLFGAPMFSIPNNTLYPTTSARFVMEFKKGASARLLYDDEMNIIVKEHLVSESNEPHKKYTLIGDGDYEGFRWMNDRWQYVSKIFTYVTPENQPPMPSRFLNDDGNNDNVFPDLDGPATQKKNKKKRSP